MQQHLNTGAGECASMPAKISRRFLMQGFAGAAAVAATATVAVASVQDSPPLSDAAGLHACILELEAILRRMDPDTKRIASDYYETENGAFVIVNAYNSNYKGTWGCPV